MLDNSVQLKLYIIPIISIFLFSCNFENNNNDVAISNLEDRLVELNNQILNLNLDISRLDSSINNQLLIIRLLTDSSFILPYNNSETETSVNEDTVSIDPEKLFKEKFSISSLSVLTCTLKNIEKNRVERFYKEDLVKINRYSSNNNQIVEEYIILEINKLKRFIKVKSVNYDVEFLMYMDTE